MIATVVFLTYLCLTIYKLSGSRRNLQIGQIVWAGARISPSTAEMDEGMNHDIFKAPEPRVPYLGGIENYRRYSWVGSVCRILWTNPITPSRRFSERQQREVLVLIVFVSLLSTVSTIRLVFNLAGC